MSAAAARRRKQLAARQAAGAAGTDSVQLQLQTLLSDDAAVNEATAYEALQLAQSLVRKREHAGDAAGATDLAFSVSLTLLQKGRVSVASQLMTVLIQVLRETHTAETDEWLDRLCALHAAHSAAMDSMVSAESSNAARNLHYMQEVMRLHRLQRDWLRTVLQWSHELGTVRHGHGRLHELTGQQCWKLSTLERVELSQDVEAADNAARAADYETVEEEIHDWYCDAVTHMALAEQPATILQWLSTLPAPTAAETAAGHDCPAALREALLTRSILVFCAMENLRDANRLLKDYITTIEERNVADLATSYTNKEDGKAPSHVTFCSMLLRICEKDVRTGPLFSWLMRSFKRELELLYKPAVIAGYTTKIGKVYFHIQPPPSMLNMMENMMNMMGGGGGMGGMGGGMNPAMLQAAMAQMQQGGMM